MKLFVVPRKIYALIIVVKTQCSNERMNKHGNRHIGTAGRFHVRIRDAGYFAQRNSLPVSELSAESGIRIQLRESARYVEGS